MFYLIDYEEIDGGYVTFGGNPKGGKITGRCTIKTGKLDFANVYFVRELKFNLFSVSQMCDKKNSVLFNDTECIVLSPNFKLTVECDVLLKVPRKNNMYIVDLKNIVPKEDSKDETSAILKTFITGIENLADHKVKVIRCDNGTQFKNREMNQFCEMKGKFDGKADEGLFVGYSLNSKAFRVFNNRTRIMEENLHIRFSENTPNIVGTKTCDDAGKARKETVPAKDYILLPLWTADPLISQESKSFQDDGFQPLSDDGKKVDEVPRQKSECKYQKKENNDNNTNYVNDAVTNRVNVVGENTNNELPFDPEMPKLEYMSTFTFSNEDEDDGAEANMNNLRTTIQFSPTSTTRI
nr:putative ribonuclease H-like domain-containing protein [Tanacetum cinerariifolium]